MNEYRSILKADKIIRYGTFVSTGIILVALVYIAIIYRQLPPVIPLYNQMPWGENRLGTKPEFFILPAVALLVLLGNSFLSSILYGRMPLIARALAITCLLVNLLTGIFIFRTVQMLL